MSQHTDENRVRALRVLARTAAESVDGQPNFAATARETGVARRTLRRWWQARDPSDDLQAAAPATSKPTPPTDAEATAEAMERARAFLSMGPADFRAAALAELILERDRATSDTARAQLTRRLVDLAQEIRPPQVEEVDPSTLPREEWEAMLLEQARAMTDLDLEVILGVYAERHKSRLVLVGPGGNQAELIDGAWVQL